MNKSDPIYVSGVNYESMVDGTGVRATIFFSGCPHHCHNCHNPSTWSVDAGVPATDELIQEIADGINKRSFLTGITLSGGDPFYMPMKTLAFLDKLSNRIKNPKIHDSIWAYTGYTFEELMSRDELFDVYQLLDDIAVLIDGRFEEEKADRTLLFRGSSNQRIIDVALSCIATSDNKRPTVVLWNGGDSNRNLLQLHKQRHVCLVR